MTRKTDNAVLNQDDTTNNAKIKINALELYVSHYTLSLEELNSLMNQITKKTPTHLHYPEKFVFMKEVISQSFWTFELGVQESIDIPVWVHVVFQQSDRQHNQNLNNDTFYRLPVTSDQVVIGNEKNPDSAILLSYDDDQYSQAKGQLEEAFRVLTKEKFVQPYKTEDVFRLSNDGDNIGYNIQFRYTISKKF